MVQRLLIEEHRLPSSRLLLILERLLKLALPVGVQGLSIAQLNIEHRRSFQDAGGTGHSNLTLNRAVPVCA
jgi:hypothetical protein